MRIAITGGKTGGHVYPALAVIDALRDARPELTNEVPRAPAASSKRGSAREDTAELMYVGIAGGIEDRVVAPTMPLLRLTLTTPDSPSRTLRTLLDFLRATLRCLHAFRKFSPDVLFSTGGFVSVPATMAAGLLRRPIVMFLPDVVPGTTLRLLCRLAQRVGVSTADSLTRLPEREKAVVTGYPVRQAFFKTDREIARRNGGLVAGELQLLVMGGSLGAASINRSVARGLDRLLRTARVVHICGPVHFDEMTRVRESLSEEHQSRYHLFGSLDDEGMAAAMFASDLAITRAGASILGELPQAGLPAIVVPLPAKRVGQEANAAWLQRANAALTISNHHAEEGELVATAEALLRDADIRLSMARAMRELRRPNAATEIARLIEGAAARSA